MGDKRRKGIWNGFAQDMECAIGRYKVNDINLQYLEIV